MAAYFLRRLLLMIPTFLGITFLVFTVTRFVPGGPIEQMIARIQMGGGEAGGGGAHATGLEIPEKVLEELRVKFKLDQPIWKAYPLWLFDVIRLDFGKSYKFNAPVLDVITERFPVSIYFGLIGFILAYIVCVPLGVMKAVRHAGLFDFATSALVFAAYSIPGWALGAILLVLFGGGSFWDVVPLGGFRSENWHELGLLDKILDQAHHTILPILAYAITSFAALTILTKNALMENLGQDFVRTAFAKGLTERRVIFVHALRNSLIPVCTGLGHALSLLMAGSYLVERVFNIDGIGYLGYTALVERDYAVVMGILVINTGLILLGNILSDVLYVLVDPRIRFQ
jgi:microcin C transport system permease protein